MLRRFNTSFIKACPWYKQLLTVELNHQGSLLKGIINLSRMKAGISRSTGKRNIRETLEIGTSSRMKTVPRGKTRGNSPKTRFIARRFL